MQKIRPIIPDHMQNSKMSNMIVGEQSEAQLIIRVFFQMLFMSLSFLERYSSGSVMKILLQQITWGGIF